MTTRSDFADWLSPMVVKELRQGMRSRLFVLSFLIVQAAMILVALIGLALSANHQGTGAATGFFWTIIGVPLLLIMPLSGLNTVAAERRANTLELVFLTRLTARRILAGKWLALLAQTALLVCAVLPYAVLRYFLGGINVATELVGIAALLSASALLCGVSVGLSPQLSRLGRGLLAVVIFLSLQFLYPLASFFLIGLGGPVTGRSSLDALSWIGLFVAALLLLLLMWEFGASKIAPAAENHSSSRRLIAVGALALFVLFFNTRPSSPVWIGALGLLLPVCLGALCEQISPLPRIYRPFVRRGILGKLAGRFFYPGWPSGVFFVLASLFVIAGGIWAAGHRVGLERFWWTSTATAGALLLPAALVHTFFPRARRPGIIYLLIQGAFGLLVALSLLIEGVKLIDLRAGLAVIPTCGLLLLPTGVVNESNFSLLAIGTTLVTLLSIFLLVLKMIVPWKQIHALEKAAAAPASPAPSDAPLPAPTK